MTNSTGTTAGASPSADITYLFFASLLVMMLFARFISYFFYRLGVPRIVGDIIAGCILGPTVLQSSTVNIFDPSNNNIVHTIGYMGLIMASMTSGANFNPRVLDGQMFKVISFSVVNIGFSLAASYACLYALPDIRSDPHFIGAKYEEVSYQLFFGSAFAATSLPMTFLILDELKLSNQLAKFCIGTSTVATVLLFTLVSVAQAYSEQSDDPILGKPSQLIPFRICMLIVIILALYAVKSIWEYGLSRFHGPKSWFYRTSTDQTLFIIALCFAIAIAADRLGYTFVLGAFLMGAFLPIDLVAADGKPASHIRTDFTKLIKWTARWVLLPMFFLDIGLKFDIRYINSYWGHVVAVLVWGYVAKLVSTVLFARFCLRFSWNDAWFCGWLANCRGFNALVVASEANIDQQFGPISFSIGVLFSVTSSACAGFMCKYFHQRETQRLSQLPSSISPTDVNMHATTVKDSFEIRPFWKDDDADADSDKTKGQPPLSSDQMTANLNVASIDLAAVELENRADNNQDQINENNLNNSTPTDNTDNTNVANNASTVVIHQAS